MKHGTRVRLRALLVSVAALLLVLLGTSPLLRALSIEEEEKLGQEFQAKIERHFELLEDDFANVYMDDLGQQLAGSLETAPFTFRFFIICNDTPNAFAAPGGRIFIFSGLINLLETVDELAAVISHELGHVDARHLSHRIDQAKKIGLATLAGILAGALIGGEIAEAVATGSVAAGLQAQLHYSREDERQADILGFQTMLKAGFDPAGMLSTLQKLESSRWDRSENMPTYLQTHPSGPERMAALDRLLAGVPPDHARQPSGRPGYAFFKAAVQARCMDPSRAEPQLRRNIGQPGKAPAAHFGLGILYKTRGRYEEAVEHLQEALTAYPDLPAIWIQLGDTLQLAGRSREAVKALEKALSLDEIQSPRLRFQLGSAHMSLGHYREAIELFEGLAGQVDAPEGIHYNLGMAYGKSGQLARAHYHLGLHFKARRQPEKAAFHFQKALSLAQDDPPLAKKIRKAWKEPRKSAPRTDKQLD